MENTNPLPSAPVSDAPIADPSPAMPAATESPTDAPMSAPLAYAAVVETTVAIMGLPTDVGERVKSLLSGLGATSATPEQVALLAHATNRDEELRDADTTGYLRGRNEQIDATQHFPPSADTAPVEQEPPAFPRYNRRSVWNL